MTAEFLVRMADRKNEEKPIDVNEVTKKDYPPVTKRSTILRKLKKVSLTRETRLW